MKVSLKWLSEYVDVPRDIKAFCDRLDLTGTGVEGVESRGDAFDHIVCGKIISKEPHPDSDHMWVTMVDVGNAHLGQDGSPEPLQIVCGAQNFEAGDHIVVALAGSELPGGITIKKSKLRGVVSNGMNCSERELGLGDDHQGIMILPEDTPVGMPFAEYAGLADTVLDLEITPNRPDCLSIAGMAREVGAMYASDVHDPLAEMAAKLDSCFGGDVAVEDEVRITIEDGLRCPRYTARVIHGVKVGPSPAWMVERLAAIGQRSINNIVDVTNYILYLFGQPLHSFDLNKLKGADGKAHIVVRAAREGEKLETLDGEDRELIPDMTVISTPEHGAVALAGVMGGMESEVTDETTDILLEAATFEPGRTSRTSRNLGLISESSLRYERGVDDNGIDVRSAAACALIVEVAGGTVSRARENEAGIVDVWERKSAPRALTFRIPRFNDMMGALVDDDFIIDRLTRLGCEVRKTDNPEELSVVAPTFRPDLEREIDLYEEVLRLWGMDRIESTLPGGRGRRGARTAEQNVVSMIGAVMRASGLNETMTYSFSDPRDLTLMRMDAEGLGEAVELINPLNAEQSLMRRTIIVNLLRSVAYNLSRGVKNVQLYELGTVFSTGEGRKRPKERKKLAGVLAGAMNEAGWNTPAQPFDFFDGKGILENLARELALPKVRFKALSAEEALHLQPGRAAEMLAGGAEIGWVGEVHPLALAAFDVHVPVVAFELDVAALVKMTQPSRPYEDVSTYPSVDVDVAFVVDESVTNEKLIQCMTSAGGKLLESIRLFDVYRDEKRLGEDKKSMAYALTYRANDRTLTSAEVEHAYERMVSKVCGATGATVRS